MAIEVLPNPIPIATRGKEFSTTLTITAPGPISSSSATLIGDQDEIKIDANKGSITISGKYVSGWQDIFTYVEAGESDKTDTPKTAIDIPNMPRGKNLYDLAQDQKLSIFRDYEISIVYTDPTTFLETTETIKATHEVQNDLDAMNKYMADYNYNET